MDRRVRHNSQGDHFSSTNCSSALSGSSPHSQSSSPQNGLLVSSSPNELNNKLVDATHWSVSPVRFNHIDKMETSPKSVQNYVWHKTIQPVYAYSSDIFQPMGMARITRSENYQMLQELAILSLSLSYPNYLCLIPPQFTVDIKSFELPVDSPRVEYSNVEKPKSVSKLTVTKECENVADPKNDYNVTFPTLQSSHSEPKPKISVIPKSLASEQPAAAPQVKSFAEVMQNKAIDKDFVAVRAVPQPPIVQAAPNRNVETKVEVTNTDVVAQIVGTNYSHLRTLETLHDVKIENPRKGKPPIFTISGEEAKVEEAKVKLLELDAKYMSFQCLNAQLMATMHNPISVKLFVPEEHLGFVIGTYGNVISTFQCFYNVVIKTKKNYDSNGQLVTTHFSMTGDEMCIRAAVEAIVQRLREAIKWMLFNSEFLLEKKECYIRAAIKPKPQKRFWPLQGSKF